MSDPIVGMPFGGLLLLVGLLELGIAWVCFSSKGKGVPTVLVAWLATSFLLYRIGLWWMGWRRPCGCMGKLTAALHISEHAADNIMKIVLAFLLIGSIGLLSCRWKQYRRSAARTRPLPHPGDAVPGD